jgi:hypothetical protein
MSEDKKKKPDMCIATDTHVPNDIFEKKEDVAKYMDLAEVKAREDKKFEDMYPETEDAVDDVTHDEAWTEEKEDKVAPVEKAGSTEIEHGEPYKDYYESADAEEKLEPETLSKEAKGHKTKSGL